MIEFTNVSKVYDNGTKALNNVSLRVDKGEFVFVVGPSGAGKSTFIKLLLREETPTKGIVKVNGYNLNKIKKRQIPQFRRSLGVVFQDFRLIPQMTVYDNVAFALRVTNVTNRSIRQRVPYVLGLVGLAAKARNYPDQLSGGEQQRVALARTLAQNPQIILADEVLTPDSSRFWPGDEYAEGKALSEQIDATVTVYELLGSEAMIYGDVDGGQVSAHISATNPVRTGSRIKVAFDVDKLHVFDKDTELAIVH